EDPVSKRPQFEALDASTGPHATREMRSRHSASTTSSDRQRLIEQQERVYRLSLDSNKGGDIQRVNSKDSGSSLDSSERESFESSFDTSQASAQPPHRHAEPRIGQEFGPDIPEARGPLSCPDCRADT
ncbi:MAG: hypothetical protein ACPIOQ_57555, partial [Promethearchaeia archaeon]